MCICLSYTVFMRVAFRFTNLIIKFRTDKHLMFFFNLGGKIAIFPPPFPSTPTCLHRYSRLFTHHKNSPSESNHASSPITLSSDIR